MTQLDPNNRYAHWSDTRLKSTHAYYRGCLKDGHPAIYDSEEDRLRLLDIADELIRRGIEPKKPQQRLCGRCGRMRDDARWVRYKETDPDPELRGSEEVLCEPCYIEVTEQYDDSDDAPVSVGAEGLDA